MARLLGPDTASRRVVASDASGNTVTFAGRTATIWADEAATVLADIATYSALTPTTPGAAIASSTVTIAADGRLPRFWFPASGADTLYATVVGMTGVQQLNADFDARLDGLGGAAALAIGTTTGTVAAGDDARFSGLALNTQTASYTLVMADAGKVVEVNSASAATVTVPPNSSVAFPIGSVVEVAQYGAGQVTIAAGSGVTVRTASSLATRTQYSSVTLRKRASDEWVLGGDAT